MDEIFSNPVYIWLLVGTLLIVFQASTSPRLGILFVSGMSAISTGIIVQIGFAESLTEQLIWFLLSIAYWVTSLWIYRNQGGRNKLNLSNAVGDSAIVVNTPLRVGEIGHVILAGKVMEAEIHKSFLGEEIMVGSQVNIKSVVRNLLRVSPK
ncbi:MAG: hypothetical protein WCL30_00080 [Pseudomonadota bacterium]